MKAVVVEPPGGPVRRRLAVEPDLHAPHLVDLEFASTLRALLAQGRITDSGAAASLAQLAALPLVRYPHHVLLERVWELRRNVTPYDAAYVALAEALGAVLLTADARLGRASGLRCATELVA